MCVFSKLEPYVFLHTKGADLPYNGQVIGNGVNRNSAIIGGKDAVKVGIDLDLYINKSPCIYLINTQFDLNCNVQGQPTKKDRDFKYIFKIYSVNTSRNM